VQPADKIARAMLAQAFPLVRRWLNVMLNRPLTLREAVIVGVVLLTAGTIYCQIYCLLALQQMHGASMPLWASVHRASVDVAPAFAAFELGKRVPPQPRWWHWLALIIFFAAAIALAVLWRLQLHKMDMALSPRRIAVDRLPFMAFAALGIAYYHARLRQKRAQSLEQRSGDSPEVMPPMNAIDWVKAAGNYVEIKAGDRTRLLRMTLRQAAEMLPQGGFVQIHRSVIDNRARIVRMNGRQRVSMADGTEFRVGDAYRSNL
jgi:DNA-binding LytR/AlgR family response regulator